METGPGVPMPETAEIHEAMIDDGMTILMDSAIIDTAPDLIARVRASLRAAKRKMVGVRIA